MINMPQQDQFLQSLGDRLPLVSRELLQATRKDLPPVVRLLFPGIRTWDRYNKVKDDPEWLAQKVKVSKKCYEVLSERLIFLAKQNERLEEVKSAFQHGMLNILESGRHNQQSTTTAAKMDSSVTSMKGVAQ